MKGCAVDNMAVVYLDLQQPWLTCTQDLHKIKPVKNSRVEKGAPEMPPKGAVGSCWLPEKGESCLQGQGHWKVSYASVDE